MGYVHFNEEGWIVDKNDKPLYIVGVNYVSSYICTNFLEDFRPDRIERDLTQMEEMGLNAVRIPVYWGSLEPEQGYFSEKYFENLAAFINMAKKHGIYTMPLCLVGISTKSEDVPYRQGRKFFEGDMLFAAENHLRTLASRFKDEEYLLFWDICDEPEWYSRFIGAEQLPFDRAKFRHWLQHMYQALKEGDPNHLVTCGFGKIASRKYGFTVKDAGKILDFMSITIYPYYYATEGADTARNNNMLSFYAKLNTVFDKPVFACEAPGASTAFFSEEILGRYNKVSFYSNLVNGGTGTMPWCFNDYDEEIRSGNPLSRKPSEHFYGIVDTTGRIKPAGNELAAFGKYVRDIGIVDYKLRKPRIAIFLPESEYYRGVEHNRTLAWATMQFVKSCGADMAFVWDTKTFSDYDMVIVPPIEMESYPDIMALMKYAEQGGKIIGSYVNMWATNPYMNTLYGMELQTKSRNDNYDHIIMQEDLGTLERGQKVEFPKGYYLKATRIGRDYLYTKAISAQVMATYPDGKPALLKNQYGKGTAWFFTGQFTNSLFDMDYESYVKYLMFSIMDGILHEENIYRPCTYINAELEVGLFEKGEGDKLLVMINHSPDPNPVKVQLEESLAQMDISIWEGKKDVIIREGCVEMTMDAAEVVTLVLKKRVE